MTTFEQQATDARRASQILAGLTRAQKDAALLAMAAALLDARDDILAANGKDVARGHDTGMDAALIDRLTLDDGRLQAMAEGLRGLAGLDDPVGQTVRGWRLPSGVKVEQVRVPFGVIGMIYEARPNVTADAAGICLKSGNAALLRGSSSAVDSNRAITAALRAGLQAAGLPSAAVQLVEGGHEATDEMMRARGLIDLLIPRGGASLIQSVVRGAQVPVIETGVGNCHLFIDESADVDMALRIALNAKTQRPSVCNALETLLVHRSVAGAVVPQVADAMTAAGVKLHGDPTARAIDPRIALADGWDDEFLSLDLRVAVVDGVDEAIAFIGAHGSGHSETIVTNDVTNQQRFTAGVDAACVLVNASSRFVDGGEFGFGAEIGISTQKLHARGPLALPEMTTTKYIVTGDGQIRA